MEKTVALTSLGCDKNRVDSEVMLGLLAEDGFRLVAEEAEADIIIVNTCCFIKDALEESIETILEMAEYKETGRCKGLIVAGCLGQRYEKEFFEELPEVDTVLALSNVEAMDGYVLTGKLTPRQFAELTDLDVEAARLLYSAYAVNEETYGQLVSGVDSYEIGRASCRDRV